MKYFLNSWAKTFFQKIQFCHALHIVSWYCAKIKKKLKTKFQSNTRIDRGTNRNYFIEPFQLPLGVQNKTKIKSLAKIFLGKYLKCYQVFAIWVIYWLELVYELSLCSRVTMFGGMAKFIMDRTIWKEKVETEHLRRQICIK